MPSAATLQRLADQYHSITFINSSNVSKNTYMDWFLIPSARPVFAPPSIVTKYVEVPGMDGYLDLTESFTTNIKGPREGQLSFYVENDHGDWFTRYENIMSFLHGKQLKAFLNDDPNHYYVGRWQVTEWANNTDGICSSITFSYRLQPDRYTFESQFYQ